MREINLIVIHCSATHENLNFSEKDLEMSHRRRGFKGTGYHFYVRKNGDIKSTRDMDRVGAHTKRHNTNSIGICYEGGLDINGKPKDTRTEWQKHSLKVLLITLLLLYPGCRVCGHDELKDSGNDSDELEPEEWIMECPCFNVQKEYNRSLKKKPEPYSIPA